MSIPHFSLSPKTWWMIFRCTPQGDVCWNLNRDCCVPYRPRLKTLENDSHNPSQQEERIDSVWTCRSLNQYGRQDFLCLFISLQFSADSQMSFEHIRVCQADRCTWLLPHICIQTDILSTIQPHFTQCPLSKHGANGIPHGL